MARVMRCELVAALPFVLGDEGLLLRPQIVWIMKLFVLLWMNVTLQVGSRVRRLNAI